MTIDIKDCPLCKEELKQSYHLTTNDKKNFLNSYYCDSKYCKLLIFNQPTTKLYINSNSDYNLIINVNNKYYEFEVEINLNRTIINEIRKNKKDKKDNQYHYYTIHYINNCYSLEEDNLEFLYKKLLKEITTLKCFK